MSRMDGAAARKERIRQIAQYVQAQLYQNKDTGEIRFSRTIAALAFDTGLTKPKIVEILELLQENGQIEIDRQSDTIKKARV